MGNIRHLGGAFALFLVAGALALSGCGSSDSGDDESTQSSTGSTQGTGTTSSEQATNASSASKDQAHEATAGSNSTGDGASSEAAGNAPEKTKLFKNFKVIPLRVSGGGSAPLTVKGGDNSIQEFGEEASESELTEAAEAVHDYYVAFSQDDWATACSYLSKGLKEGMEHLSASTKDGKMGCEEASASFYRDRPSAERSELTRVDAVSLRREGDQGFLLYHGPEYDTGGSYGPGDLYAMNLRFEDEGWKMGIATGTTLGIPKSLVQG